jgi:hypothetical protein
MSGKVITLTDGTQAVFNADESLDSVDKKLAKDGFERNKEIKPFLEKEGVSGMIDEALAKTNYPIVQGAAGLGGLAGALQKGVEFGTGKLAELLGYTPEQAQAGRMAISLPTPSDITRAVGSAGVPMQRAETIGGRAAHHRRQQQGPGIGPGV